MLIGIDSDKYSPSYWDYQDNLKQLQINFNASTHLSPTIGPWKPELGIRKTFLNKRLTLNLQANDLWNSRYSSFILFGPRLTYTKKANPDSRSFSLNISYRFNAAGKAYKGDHASEEDLRRLQIRKVTNSLKLLSR